MDNQIANSFDSKTVKKIITSVLLSSTCTVSILILQYVGTLHTNNPELVAACTFIPAIINAIKEYRSGIVL